MQSLGPHLLGPTGSNFDLWWKMCLAGETHHMYLQIRMHPCLCFSINRKIGKLPIFPESSPSFSWGTDMLHRRQQVKESLAGDRFVAHPQTSEGLGKEKGELRESTHADVRAFRVAFLLVPFSNSGTFHLPGPSKHLSVPGIFKFSVSN